MVVVAIGFAALATRLSQRLGRWTLGPLWLGASLATASLMVIRVERAQAANGMTAASGVPFPLFWMFPAMWAFGLGAVSLYVLRRSQRGATGFGAATAIRSAGIFLAGALLFFMGVAVQDFMRLF